MNFTCHVLLGAFNEGLNSFAKRCEPFSFVYNLSELSTHFLFESIGITVEDELFKLLVSFIEDSSSWSFIYASALHSYNTVFYYIDDSDTVFCTKFVESADDVGDFHLLTINCLRNTFFKCHSNISLLIRSILRCYTKNEHMLIVGFLRRIFKFETFMGQMPEVTVTAVAVAVREWKIDSVLFAVFFFIFAGLKLPVRITPGCDHADIGCKSLKCKLETDLVVSFAGCTVADGSCAFFSCNLNKTLGDSRTSHGCSKEIFVLVYCMSLNTRYYVIVTEIICYIFYIKLGCSACFGSFFKAIKFIALSAVSTYTYNVVAVGFFEPWDDRGSVKTT